MHIVKLKWSEAVTTDGRNWILYVRGEKFYDDLQDGNEEHIVVPDIKYGQWCKKEGLLRSPVRLTTFYDEIDFEGQQLLHAVKATADNLPFPYIDHHELWLLNETTRQPLALLASRCDHEIEEMPPLLQWTAGQAARRLFPALDALQQQVNQLAGKQPVAKWFVRHADSLPGGELDKAQLISATQEITQLMEWQSPYQLLLKQNNHHRMKLEKVAARHALRLVEQLSLYPEILQPRVITAALVEARMRKSIAEDNGSAGADKTIPPFYLELGD